MGCGLGCLWGVFRVVLVSDMALGALVVAVLILMIRLEMCHRALIVMADNVKEAFKRDIQEMNKEFDVSIVDTLRDNILETIEEMRPPSIADHLGGIMQQFAQMKLMRMMKEEGLMMETHQIEEGV